MFSLLLAADSMFGPMIDRPMLGPLMGPFGAHIRAHYVPTNGGGTNIERDTWQVVNK